MKLKRYSKFLESTDTIKRDIRDIFLDLEEDGFSIDFYDLFKTGRNKSDPSLSSYGLFKDEISVSKLNNSDKKIVDNYLCVKITNISSFSGNDILEDVSRLVDFLENYNNYELSESYFKNDTWSGKYPCKIGYLLSLLKEHDKLNEVKIYFRNEN
jgi:hypothetical protein